MNTPPPPDFYISVSTNPPKITGIGKTCGDSMEKLEVGLGPMVSTMELSHLKGKIGRILGKPIIPESQMEDLDTQLRNIEIRQGRYKKKLEANKKEGLASILPEDEDKGEGHVGKGKKTKRRRNKRRKTKRSKSKTFKKQKVTSNRIM